MNYKKFFLIFISSFAICLYFEFNPLLIEASTIEKEGIPIDLSLQNDFSIFPEIEKNIMKLESLVASDNLQGIEEVIKQVAFLRAKLETDNLPFVSGFFRTIGEHLVSSGKKDTGIFILEKSSEAFPGDYRIHLALSRVYFSPGNFSPSKGYSTLKRGINDFVSLETREKWLYSLISACVMVVSVLSIYIYFLFLFVKIFWRLHFDLKRFFFSNLNFAYSGYLTGVIIFIPFVLGGFYSFILSLPIYAWNYLSGFRAKALLIVLSLYLFLFPFVFKTGLEGIFTTSSQLTKEIERFTNNSWDFNTLNTFKASVTDDQDNLFFNLAIGLMYKRMGENQKAYDLLKKLVEKYPENTSALVNFGNINLILGDNQSALTFYREAIKVDPNSAEAYYNMSLALSSLIKFEDADSAFNKAYELDSKKIQEFLNLKINDKGDPLDEIPKMNLPPKKEISSNLSNDDYRMFLKFLLVPEVMYGLIPPFIYLMVVAGVIVVFRIYPIKLSDICDECGSIINRRAGCTLCISLLLPHNRVDQKKREKGVVKVWKNAINKRVIPFGLNLIVPGGAYVYENRDIIGFFMIFLSSMLIIPICISFFYANTPVTFGFLVILYLGYYLFSNLTLFFRKF